MPSWDAMDFNVVNEELTALESEANNSSKENNEAGFNLHMNRTRGWVEEMESCEVSGFSKERENQTEKLLKLLVELERETEHYLAYLSNVMDVLQKNDLKGFYLVMDNAHIHKPATLQVRGCSGDGFFSFVVDWVLGLCVDVVGVD
ncbi:hypothetical protein BD770DRAFT_446092 [Pilaira anomala]|nr:hypothetical protein BD770DRAFT_446092 [Pilaira anomala]